MLSASSTLPDTGFVRLTQIIGNPKATPPIPGVIPISRATWFKWQAEGKAPKPVKLGDRIAAYPVETIREFIRALNTET